MTYTGLLRCNSGPFVDIGSLGTIVVRLEAKVLVGQNYVFRSHAYGSVCDL